MNVIISFHLFAFSIYPINIPFLILLYVPSLITIFPLSLLCSPSLLALLFSLTYQLRYLKVMAAPALSSTQDEDFYVSPWSRAVETTLLSLIQDEILADNWIVGDPENNREVLRGIRQEIGHVRLCPELANVHIGVFFLKYSQWRRRFHSFTFLISHPQVFYLPVLPPTQFGRYWWMCALECCTTVLRVN